MGSWIFWIIVLYILFEGDPNLVEKFSASLECEKVEQTIEPIIEEEKPTTDWWWRQY